MSENSMIELVKQVRRDYQNEWRSKNKDKVKGYNQRYWEKKAAELAASKQQEESNGEGQN